MEGCTKPATLVWKVNGLTWVPLCEAHARDLGEQMTWCETIVARLQRSLPPFVHPWSVTDARARTTRTHDL